MSRGPGLRLSSERASANPHYVPRMTSPRPCIRWDTSHTVSAVDAHGCVRPGPEVSAEALPTGAEVESGSWPHSTCIDSS